MSKDNLHTPVFAKKILEIFNPVSGEVYLDCTFGRGGHSKLLIQKDCKVIALDRDLDAVNWGKENIQNNKFTIFHGLFSQINQILDLPVNGILLDLGLCSTQIDSNRGFSYLKDGPLDMSMGISNRKLSTVLNKSPRKKISDILFFYGEERRANKIAQRIVEKRPLKSIQDLINIMKDFYQNYKILARVFQAFRIYINNELEELENFFSNLHLLKKGGKLIIISFHSLEDRIVKKHITNKEDFLWQKSNLIFPTQEEINLNTRSRSAKMRWAVKK